MSRSNTVDMTGQASEVQVTGEPRDTETVTRGSERGRWKSARQGNSLAIYSTSCTVLRGVRHSNVPCLPGVIRDQRAHLNSSQAWHDCTETYGFAFQMRPLRPTSNLGLQALAPEKVRLAG